MYNHIFITQCTNIKYETFCQDLKKRLKIWISKSLNNPNHHRHQIRPLDHKLEMLEEGVFRLFSAATFAIRNCFQ